ncbi:purine or other phosphorylase family 1 [Ornithinibacillus scapharcae]|uniref:phosphorylase family protein n=1 Tax=Ornithinibacillus scapharcae TaxID=1147159 RepID=UPI000225ADCD|nr:purine or other phosphorylase family 1 [Ornithinibacillus scapharcae]
MPNEQWIGDWNTVIGNYDGKRIGFANVYGGPSAAVTAHRYAVLGTENFIQTGYFGGLSHEVQYGDILIVTGAWCFSGGIYREIQWFMRIRS